MAVKRLGFVAVTPQEGRCGRNLAPPGCVCVCLFATFSGRLIDCLVEKDSFLRGSAIFSEKVAKRHPRWQDVAIKTWVAEV